MSYSCKKCGKPMDTDKELCTDCASAAESKTDFPIIDEKINKQAINNEISSARKKLLRSAALILAAFVCVALIIFGVVMLLSSDGDDTASPTDTTVIADDDSSESALGELKSDIEIYTAKINEFIAAAEEIIEKGSAQIPYDIDGLDLETIAEDLGCAFIDLDNNGINELLIGNLNEKSEFYIMYTIKDGKLECLYHYKANEKHYLGEDNRIIIETYASDSEPLTEEQEENITEKVPADSESEYQLPDPTEEETTADGTIPEENAIEPLPVNEELPKIISYRKESLETNLIEEIQFDDNRNIWLDSSGNPVSDDAIDKFKDRAELKYIPLRDFMCGLPSEDKELSENANEIFLPFGKQEASENVSKPEKEDDEDMAEGNSASIPFI